MDFDVYELVNVTASIFTKQVVDKNIVLDVDIAPDIPRFLVGDEARLRQIFINLIGNAVKYTFEGTVGFSVKRLNDSSDPGKVKLQFDVSDTGIGIPEDKQDCLFQAFVQAEKSSARIYGGTGLGLAIVKQLTNKMGGTVALKSKPGQGSTFTIIIELPISSKTSIERCKEKFHQTIPENKLIKALNPNNVNGKILVVEDSKVNLQITCSLLDKFGCEYEVASNGLEAVDLFRREGGNFKLILMDYHMPIMDGYDAAVEIRKIESQNNSYTPVPIIALTASGSYADRKKCSEAGMNGFLEKPFNKEQVEHCLEKWLTTFKQTAS
jgi:CheY-like chemotaxis protein